MIRIVMALAGVLVSAGIASAQTPSITRWSKGVLEYRRLSTGEISGSEAWKISVHKDGSRTLNTANQHYNAGASRDIILRVGADFRPRELYASFWYQGDWVGSGWFTVDGAKLNATAMSPHGRVTQEVAIPGNFGFIPHPIAGNVWQVGFYDKSKRGPQDVTSYDLQTRVNGPGVILGPMATKSIIYVGAEKITTPAGVFDVDHYRSGTETDMYLTGPDLIPVKFVWPGGDEEYVLMSLEQSK